MNLKMLARACATVAALSAIAGCAAPPPKVLVANYFHGVDKTTKVLIKESGKVDPSTKRKLFDVFVRVCNLDASNTEAACHEALVVADVAPGSVY